MPDDWYITIQIETFFSIAKRAAFKKCSFSAVPKRPDPNFREKHTATELKPEIVPDPQSNAVSCLVTSRYFLILSIYLYPSRAPPSTLKFNGSGLIPVGASITS